MKKVSSEKIIIYFTSQSLHQCESTFTENNRRCVVVFFIQEIGCYLIVKTFGELEKCTEI